MLAEDDLKQGNLGESLLHLQEMVRQRPAEPKYRTFLFQLLAIMGEWKRAVTQLGVLGELDASTLPMVHTYREAIRCEIVRANVFAGHRTPTIVGNPDRWLALLLEALRLMADGHEEQAAALREEALELAPATNGSVNGEPFQWFADADSRLGPVIEAVINGAYSWVPVHRLKEIQVSEPADLRDFIWMPAEVQFANGGGCVALIPARYPGSAESDDPLIRLCKRTDWRPTAGRAQLGLGQRLFATDVADYPILDVRSVCLNVETAADGSGESANGVGVSVNG